MRTKLTADQSNFNDLVTLWTAWSWIQPLVRSLERQLFSADLQQSPNGRTNRPKMSKHETIFCVIWYAELYQLMTTNIHTPSASIGLPGHYQYYRI